MIEQIEKSPELQMACSELLHGLLGMGHWHKWDYKGHNKSSGIVKNDFGCLECPKIISVEYEYSVPQNPNLFSDWNGFGLVIGALRAKNGSPDYLWANFWNEIIVIGSHSQDTSLLNVPHFQLAVLRWLLKKEGRLEELERLLGKGGESEELP